MNLDPDDPAALLALLDDLSAQAASLPPAGFDGRAWQKVSSLLRACSSWCTDSFVGKPDA